MKNTKGYVYLAGFDEIPGYYKIGFANNVTRRIAELESGCPFKIIVYHSIEVSFGQKLERFLHRKFQNKRVKLEWFLLTSDDVNYIKAVKETSMTDNANRLRKFYMEKDQWDKLLEIGLVMLDEGVDVLERGKISRGAVARQLIDAYTLSNTPKMGD